MVRQKGRYFSVRFSASLLERIETARIELYGERTTIAETIRRLIEEALINHTSANAMPLTKANMQRLGISAYPLAEELTQVAIAVDRLIQQAIKLSATEGSPHHRSITASFGIAEETSDELLRPLRRSL
jgi:hypothetical protein